jgi:hypothetical protein
MQRPTLVALSFCLVILSQACFQAKASPIPRNLQPSKDSPSACLTVIFFLVLSLTILFIFKKIYVARRRKTDLVSISSDESAPKSNWKGGRSMTKAIAKKSGFYVGLLGSPGWETKHSVFIGGGPTHIFLPPESRTSNRRRFPFGSLTTTILHKVPAQCEITSNRLAPNNVLQIKPQKFNAVVFSPEISIPPPAKVTQKHPNLCFDTKPSPMKRSSSRLTTQDEQHDDSQSNGNITFSSGPRKLVSGLNSLQSRIDQNFGVSPVSNERRSSNTYNSSVADITIPTQTFRTLMKHSRLPTDLLENGIQQPTIKPLHFGKRRHTISEKYYSDNANDCPDVFVPWASYKTPDLPKTCCQSVDLSTNSVWLKSRCSSPTRQTRNSPIIGPSPLRTMSLPLDYDFEHTKQFNVDNCNILSKIRSEAKFEPSLESPPSLSHSSPPPERSKTLFQADDPDIILDLIRELAQETSAWDASLFVDENFKALMDQSTVHPKSKPKVQIVPEKWSKYRQKYRRTTLQDIPESDGTKYNLFFFF